MTNIKLVLIDFDDTLCLTEENGFHLENEVAVSMGFKPQSRQVHQSTWGKPLPEVAQVRFPNIDIDKFMVAVGQAMAQKASKQEFDVVSATNISTISKLRSKGYRVGIVTSRTKKEVDHLMCDPHPLISVLIPQDIFYKEKTLFGKPDPRVFNIPLSYYGVSNCDAIYVGDSVSDAIAAKQAGLGSIISTESNLHQQSDFPLKLVDSFIAKFSDLPKVIKKLSKTGIITNTITPAQKQSLLKNKVMSVPHDLLNKS